MSSFVEALATSVRRLRDVVGQLDGDALTGSAYPADWTIAQVMSHLGSGAVISQRRLEDGLAGTVTPDEFAPQVWDEWNAKSPRDQVDDGLTADAAFLDRLAGVSADDRRDFSFAMGPMEFDFDGFVGLRLNEHAFHTWDIEVTLDPAATIPAPIAGPVVDNIGLVARFTAKPTGSPGTARIHTTDPERIFMVEFTTEGATLEVADDDTGSTPLELAAESFARLVYGRLDPAHTPAFTGDPAVLDRLRATFPGP